MAKADPARAESIPLAAVIGHPVSHSLSPHIFSFLAEKTRRPLVYKRLDVDSGSLSGLVRVIRGAPVFVGWNVTIPHKQSIARLVDELSPEARVIGAVNVVQFREGAMRGYNTDCLGIAETFREQGLKLRGRSALLFGAGGAALAAGYEVGRAGASCLYIANRTVSRARRMARELGHVFPRTRFVALKLDQVARVAEPIALYVNSTPLGMKGFASQSLLPDRVSRGALAFDLVYRPARTPFLADAQRKGLRTVGGLDMLIWQALGTWEIWFGKLPARARIKSALRNHLEKKLK